MRSSMNQHLVACQIIPDWITFQSQTVTKDFHSCPQGPCVPSQNGRQPFRTQAYRRMRGRGRYDLLVIMMMEYLIIRSRTEWSWGNEFLIILYNSFSQSLWAIVFSSFKATMIPVDDKWSIFTVPEPWSQNQYTTGPPIWEFKKRTKSDLKSEIKVEVHFPRLWTETLGRKGKKFGKS